MKETRLHHLTQQVERLSEKAESTGYFNTSESKYFASQMALLKGIIRGEKAVQNNQVFSNKEALQRLSKWM